MSYKDPNEPSIQEMQAMIKAERERLADIQHRKFYNNLRERLRSLQNNDGKHLRPLNPEPAPRKPRRTWNPESEH
jgi:DNA replication initiation complex subunit (GINS family)